MAEAYNETHRGSLKVELFKQFLVENSKIGRHFQRKPNNEDIIDDDVYDPTEEETSNDNHARNTMYELHRKNVSKALYNQWILEELKDRKKVGKILFSSTNLIPSALLAPEIPEIYLLEIGFGE